MIIVFSIGVVLPAYADHHFSGQKWGTTFVQTCYLSTQLKQLNIDGSSNQIIIVNAALDSARNDWNDEPSVWEFNRGISPCNHTLGSGAFGSGGALGVTTRTPLSGNPLTDNDTRFNRDVNWTSGTSCTSAPNFNLKYVATHEFGHWLRLLDVSSGFPSDTIMWHSYDCSASSITSHDSSTLTNIYG